MVHATKRQRQTTRNNVGDGKANTGETCQIKSNQIKSSQSTTGIFLQHEEEHFTCGRMVEGGAVSKRRKRQWERKRAAGKVMIVTWHGMGGVCVCVCVYLFLYSLRNRHPILYHLLSKLIWSDSVSRPH